MPPTTRAGTKAKIEVSRPALLARLKRRLAQDDKRLITSRSVGEKRNVGDFFIVSDRNVVTDQHVNPAQLARELDVLKPWETAPDFEKGGRR